MFHAMVFCHAGGANSPLYNMPDFLVKNTSFTIQNECELLWGWLSADGMSLP